MDDQDDLQKITRHILRTIGESKLRAAKPDDAFPYSAVPLCVIDAVFSIQALYTGTWNTVYRWAQRHKWEMCKWRTTDDYTTSQFLDIITRYGDNFDDIAETEFHNHQRLIPSSSKSITKAEGVVRFTKILKCYSVERLEDALTIGWSSKLRSEIESIPGHSTGTIYNYFMMLAGDTNAVKADTMIRRFVTSALNVKNVQPPRAENSVRGAAKNLKTEFPNLTPSLLDNLIWRYQRSHDPNDRGGARHTDGAGEAVWDIAARECAKHKPSPL